jgi:hypothetical protein
MRSLGMCAVARVLPSRRRPLAPLEPAALHRSCVPPPLTPVPRRRPARPLGRRCRCPQEKAQAQAFANALGTIGKFIIKKKTGDKDQLFAA